MKPFRYVDPPPSVCRFPRSTLDCCVGVEAALALAADAERVGDRAAARAWETWALEAEERLRAEKRARDEAERAAWREGAA